MMNISNCNIKLSHILLLCIIQIQIQHVVSLSITESSKAQTARSRLSEAFRSPSKKLTYHPEIVLPEPSDPTALLLRASEVTKLSSTLRMKAKANAIFVEGTVDALTPMGKEQEDARGNFPGPVPIIYSLAGGGEDGSLSDTLNQLQSVDGVEGVMVPFFDGKEINSVDSYLEESSDDISGKCGAIWDAGLQPIPEITISPSTEWSEDDVIKLVDAIKDTCGGIDPVSVVFTNAEKEKSKEDNEEEGEENDEASVPDITIPTSIAKRLTFIGSVRAKAGEGRMNIAASKLSGCNFNGAFLRADCVPGYRLNPDLEVVGGFWSAAMGDIKSLKSKNFSFRSKVKLAKDVPMEWYNYQKDIMESGALGGSAHSGVGDLDPDSGDYKGF